MQQNTETYQIKHLIRQYQGATIIIVIIIIIIINNNNNNNTYYRMISETQWS